MNKKKVLGGLLIVLIIAVLIYFVFFHSNMAKKFQIGNNKNSQELINDMLNMNSYEAIMTVEVQSNKNTNKYKLKQQYVKPDIIIQEVIEPSNITGVKITKNGNQLKLENTQLNLSTVFESYEYLSDNLLDLNDFIEDYQNDKKAQIKEEEQQIKMIVVEQKESKNEKIRILYIDKKTGLPTKMEVNDENSNNMINILYNEVKINSLNKENILAFDMTQNKKSV